MFLFIDLCNIWFRSIRYSYFDFVFSAFIISFLYKKNVIRTKYFKYFYKHGYHKDYTVLSRISAQSDWEILGDFKLFKLNNKNKNKLLKNYIYVKYGIIMPSSELHMLKTKGTEKYGVSSF